jgi:hypothetical protein
VAKHPPSKDLTTDQSEILQKAAFLIISARKEAASMLARAGIELPDGFRNPCNAHIEGHGNCGCDDYRGEGGPCLTRVTVDIASPPVRSCGHLPMDHLST